MGFDDRFKIAVSDTQAYTQAENAMVVNVLINLLRSIGIEKYYASSFTFLFAEMEINMKTIDQLIRHARRIKEVYNDAGIKVSLLRYILSKRYRSEKKNERKEYWRKKTQDLGYFSTANTPGDLFNEVLLDKIYKVDGFEPKKGDAVIDIGAYYGDSAIWWAKEFESNVVAFEPLPEAFKELTENLTLNHVKDKVVAYNVALGSGEKITGGKGKGTMFNYADKEQTLETKRLDDFKFKKVDIIKIDVEGFEYEVLQGAVDTIRRFHPKLILETHSTVLRQKCDSLLKDLGYELTVEGRTGVSDREAFDKITNLFYSFSRPSS